MLYSEMTVGVDWRSWLWSEMAKGGFSSLYFFPIFQLGLLTVSSAPCVKWWSKYGVCRIVQFGFTVRFWISLESDYLKLVAISMKKHNFFCHGFGNTIWKHQKCSHQYSSTHHLSTKLNLAEISFVLQIRSSREKELILIPDPNGPDPRFCDRCRGSSQTRTSLHKP